MPVFRWKRFALPALALLVAGTAAVALILSHDDDYGLQEFCFRDRYKRFDDMIVDAGRRYAVSPALVKAVVWRESRFQPHMLGTRGERGLMQVTEAAASDWARAEKIETYKHGDLLDPRTNIQAGTWYLSNALRHWGAKDDPVPFALAEFNAGRTRVKRWQAGAPEASSFGAKDLSVAMDFPGTKAYVAAIIERYRDFLKQAGPELGQIPAKPAGFFLDRPELPRD